MATLVAATTFDFGVKAGGSFFKNDWSDNDGSEKTLTRVTIGAFALANIYPDDRHPGGDQLLDHGLVVG